LINQLKNPSAKKGRVSTRGTTLVAHRPTLDC